VKKILFILLLFPILSWAQKTAILKGVVKDKSNNPIENVSVKFNNTGTTTDENGNYQIRIPVKETVNIIFSHVLELLQKK